MEFLEQHPLYVVAIIGSVVWLGIFFFMLGIERRVKKLERTKARL